MIRRADISALLMCKRCVARDKATGKLSDAPGYWGSYDTETGEPCSRCAGLGIEPSSLEGCCDEKDDQHD